MKKLSFYLSLSLLISIAMSCSNDDDAANVTTQNLTLNIDGLEDLGSNFVYEGWVIVDGNPISTGTFSVDGSGNLSRSSFEVDIATVQAATKFVLTIEPTPDPDPAPSDQKYLAGDFNGQNSATVSTGVAPALGDFSNASGMFFLRTPTDEAAGVGNNGNDQYGVWFGTPGMPPTPNFVLPTLPQGWAYEGWVIGDNGPISTGVFTDFNTRDSSNPFSGTENAGPPVPGEDFFINAPAGETFPLDIRGRTVVISVEPVPDNSPAPFTLKPLAGISGTNTAPATHSFNLNLQSFPSGSVSR